MSSRLLQDYQVKKLLGKGVFGVVLECKNKLDAQSYAIKVTEGKDTDALREVRTLVQLPPCKNVVQYIVCWEDNFTQREISQVKSLVGINGVAGGLFLPDPRTNRFQGLCIQMELCGKDLRKWLGTRRAVNEDREIDMFIQLGKGLKHIHKHNIIHRDLKPENIFLAIGGNTVVKIGDLGIATLHNSSRALVHTQGAGTPLYLAPEQKYGKYDKRVDMFALGIIFMELLQPDLQPEFNNGSLDKLAAAVQNLTVHRKVPKTISSKWPTSAKVILNLTSSNPENRPNYSKLKKTFGIGMNSTIGRRQASANPNQTFDQLVSTMAATSLSSNPKVVHYGVRCNHCGQKNIEGIRYKCTKCANYNLCESCEKKKGVHSENHPLIKIRKRHPSPTPPPPQFGRGKEIHYNVYCDGCGEEDFEGERWKCIDCYDFDLCGPCFDSPHFFHEDSHHFERIQGSYN